MLNKIKAHYSGQDFEGVFDVALVDFGKKFAMLSEDINDETVKQFLVKLDEIEFIYKIGYLDRNGDTIWSGDIIEVPHEKYKMHREVEWKGKNKGLYVIDWSVKHSAFMGIDVTDDFFFFNRIYLWVLKDGSKKEIDHKYLEGDIVASRFISYSDVDWDKLKD